MSKKLKILIPVLVALVLLTVGGAATVMAEDQPTPPPETKSEVKIKGLLTRVAEILGIPEEELANAVKQAQSEMREEAFNQALAKAVEKGRLTEEAANEIKEWWGQRPAALGQGQFPPMFGAPGMGGRHMGGAMGPGFWGGRWQRPPKPPAE